MGMPDFVLLSAPLRASGCALVERLAGGDSRAELDPTSWIGDDPVVAGYRLVTDALLHRARKAFAAAPGLTVDWTAVHGPYLAAICEVVAGQARAEEAFEALVAAFRSAKAGGDVSAAAAVACTALDAAAVTLAARAAADGVPLEGLIEALRAETTSRTGPTGPATGPAAPQPAGPPPAAPRAASQSVGAPGPVADRPALPARRRALAAGGRRQEMWVMLGRYERTPEGPVFESVGVAQTDVTDPGLVELLEFISTPRTPEEMAAALQCEPAELGGLAETNLCVPIGADAEADYEMFSGLFLSPNCGPDSKGVLRGFGSVYHVSPRARDMLLFAPEVNYSVRALVDRFTSSERVDFQVIHPEVVAALVEILATGAGWLARPSQEQRVSARRLAWRTLKEGFREGWTEAFNGGAPPAG